MEVNYKLGAIIFSRLPENSEAVINQMVELAKEVIDQAEVEKDKIVGVGVGVPGIIDERGRTIRWPQSLGDKDINVCSSIKDTFENRLGIPAFVENDANAAVLGEKWLGLDRDVRHMLYMFSGVGCGILINEEIFRGAAGAAGELGITCTKQPKDQAFDIATQLGRWEMDLGMVRHAVELIQKGAKSSLKDFVKGDLTKMGFKDIVHGIREKDSVAIQVVQRAGEELGRKIAFLVNLLNPEVVVIGGGVEDCGATLLDAIKNSVKDWSVEEAAEVVKIIPSAFGENAVALGVVGIVAREVFAQA